MSDAQTQNILGDSPAAADAGSDPLDPGAADASCWF